MPKVFIGVQGLLATELEPGSKLRSGLQRGEQHLLVVAKHRDQVAATGQADQLLDHPSAVRPPVDVIAESDDGILGTRADRLDQRAEGRRAAVDVADDDGATGLCLRVFHRGYSRVS